MAKININTSFPNDGLGDPLRDAFNSQNSMNTELYDTKVDKVTGKELSSNDYTSAEKLKLANLQEGAEANVQADWLQGDNTQDDFIKNKIIPTLQSVTNDGNTTNNTVIFQSGNKRLEVGFFEDLFAALFYYDTDIQENSISRLVFGSAETGGGYLQPGETSDVIVNQDNVKISNENTSAGITTTATGVALRADKEGLQQILIYGDKLLCRDLFKNITITPDYSETSNGNTQISIPYYGDRIGTMAIYNIDDNYTNDTTASAGGIPIGGVYHTGGILKIRLV